MPERAAVVTLTTDFGSADPFVACMKGVILGLHPTMRIVDLTHEIPPHDVLDAAFRLRCAFASFPAGSIHVAVVDPGVGSARRPLLMVTDNHRFLAPDNGILTLVPDVEEVRQVFHVTAEHYFRSPTSATFHGRDVFAPCAAWLARGVDPSQFGEPIDDWRRLELPRTRVTPEGTARGIVWAVDRFGNVITGVPREVLEAVRERSPQGIAVRTAGRAITRHVRAYHEIEGDEPAFLLNSFDLLEIAMNRKSAARALGLKRGDVVELVPGPGGPP